MATDTVAQQQNAGIALPKLSAEQTAELYKPSTIVNNLPEDWQKILNMGAECSSEFGNPTDYKVDAIERFIRAGVKADARNVVTAWDNVVTKYSKTHAKLTREECVTELLKMRSNKEAQEKAVLAAAVLVELK